MRVLLVVIAIVMCLALGPPSVAVADQSVATSGNYAIVSSGASQIVSSVDTAIQNASLPAPAPAIVAEPKEVLILADNSRPRPGILSEGFGYLATYDSAAAYGTANKIVATPGTLRA